MFATWVPPWLQHTFLPYSFATPFFGCDSLQPCRLSCSRHFEWCGDWTPFGDDGSGSYNTPVAPFMRSCPNMQVGKKICQTLKTFSAIPIFELGDEKVLFWHLTCDDKKIRKDLNTPWLLLAIWPLILFGRRQRSSATTPLETMKSFLFWTHPLMIACRRWGTS